MDGFPRLKKKKKKSYQWGSGSFSLLPLCYSECVMSKLRPAIGLSHPSSRLSVCSHSQSE